MFKHTKFFFSNMFGKNETIYQKPLNWISILLVIFFDIFLFSNIFDGYTYQKNLTLSPYETYSCNTLFETKDTENLIDHINNEFKNQISENIKSTDLSSECQNVNTLISKIQNDTKYQEILEKIIEKTDAIDKKSNEIYDYESQYSMYLKESSAGIYSSDDRLSEIEVGNAKQNYQKILNEKTQLESDKKTLIGEIAQNENFKNLQNYLWENKTVFQEKYETALFWYPVKIALLQALLLLPLFFVSLLWYRYFYKKQNKIFTILFSNLTFITGIFVFVLFLKLVYFILPKKFFAGLIVFLKSLSLGFIWNYILVILGIALFGFIIYLSQKWAEKYEAIRKEQERVRIEQNKKKIMKERFHKWSCVECGEKLLNESDFCQSCGCKQHYECSECHAKVPKAFEFCNKCGTKNK